MDFQRVRNLTTGRLHTNVAHVHHDIEHLVGVPGIMTHQVPAALRELQHWLREKVLDRRFWDDQHDLLHAGELDIEPMTQIERDAFFYGLGRDARFMN